LKNQKEKPNEHRDGREDQASISRVETNRSKGTDHGNKQQKQTTLKHVVGYDFKESRDNW
jgi:hypothetical protein